MKTHKNITVDGNNFAKLQRYFPNQCSRLIDDFIARKIALTESDTEGMKIRDINSEIEKIDEKLLDLKLEKEHLITLKATAEQQKLIKEEERKKMEEEQALKMITCPVCGVPKRNETFKEIGGMKICRSCFLVTDVGTLRKLRESQKENEELEDSDDDKKKQGK